MDYDSHLLRRWKRKNNGCGGISSSLCRSRRNGSVLSVHETGNIQRTHCLTANPWHYSTLRLFNSSIFFSNDTGRKSRSCHWLSKTVVHTIRADKSNYLPNVDFRRIVILHFDGIFAIGNGFKWY